MMERELQQTAQNKDEEEAYKVKKRTHDLLPNADENIAKLKVRNFMIYFRIFCWEDFTRQ